MPNDLRYILLIFGLFVLPKMLQRWGIPGALTSLALGLGSTALHFLPHDSTVELLSTFGIVSIFLWAGLEVELGELRPALRPLALHLVGLATLVALAAWGITRQLGLAPAPATILSLAVLTPSTGFILDSLGAFGLSHSETRRVRSTAVVTEIFALLALFVLTQSSSWERLLVTSAALAALMSVIPWVLRVFARHIAPFAPKTEFAFLMMLAVVCAFATRKLGVYYLVGAFLVGITARRFRDQLPAMSSDRLLITVEEFAIVFGPFYFFHAGGELRLTDFDAEAIGLGLALAAVLIPIRALQTTLFQTRGSGFPFRSKRRVGAALLPTLVFSIVLLGILREQYQLGRPLVGAVMVYTLVNTMLPGLLLRRRRRGALAEAPAEELESSLVVQLDAETSFLARESLHLDPPAPLPAESEHASPLPPR